MLLIRESGLTIIELELELGCSTHDLESGGQIDAVYTDFEKAFDKVPHKRLLNKIRSYGFPRELTNWIEAFLLGRIYTLWGIKNTKICFTITFIKLGRF